MLLLSTMIADALRHHYASVEMQRIEKEVLTLSQLTTDVARSAADVESLDSHYQGC